MNKLKWGVLSTANIGLEKVLPAIQKSENGVVYAIASRNDRTARDAASHLSIPVSYSSYQDLLDDPEVEAIYNPLPNHLHIEWTIKAMEAGKHVLCEKPLALKREDLLRLMKLRDRTGLTVSEAFMVRYHPQWLTARETVQEGHIGKLKNVQGFFSYFNDDKNNIRNIKEAGGGGIWDIGCYPVTTSRLIFDEEPLRVASILEYDPETGIDRMGTVMMEFPSGQASFSCSTQLVPYQKMHIFGTKGHLEVEIPFNAPPDKACRVFTSQGELYSKDYTPMDFPVCDQYTLQAESFVRTVRGEQVNHVPLEDALKNLKVLEAIFKAGKSGMWEDVE
ncbi:Gfo/Idh/MocA family oxidoreductase [Oceanispirochaeta crateris]|uniref:Gfo/Idh/MocA family oxidoreductase n=1 Tax=Oceanispirochaeta crateris TaxID=2518645 RepID=A0A5C1QKK8_9SPIO|nr:Gfo/Idh/MocA family oxidoreductase [Oceanispirochaeta crateris]QEN07056.1 Gfo/Idh/MocA family oxidoreductase [Oceanispirochaeta crateris]